MATVEGQADKQTALANTNRTNFKTDKENVNCWDISIDNCYVSDFIRNAFSFLLVVLSEIEVSYLSKEYPNSPLWYPMQGSQSNRGSFVF